jgi:hypothetical protein
MRKRAMASLFAGLLSTGCSVFGVRSTEEPRYSVIDQLGPVEIRRYDARAAAETIVDAAESEARSIGFRRLAGYIFGGNAARQSIAMTAPVAQGQAQGGNGAGERIAMTAPVAQAPAPAPAATPGQVAGSAGWVIRFFLPAGVTAANAPVPNDKSVHVVTVPPETVAVLRYSGWYSAADIGAANAKLFQGLQGSPWHPTGAPVAWFYDPPWTLPFLRRNEAVVTVAR